MRMVQFSSLTITMGRGGCGQRVRTCKLQYAVNLAYFLDNTCTC
jgi:hypothetical protein